MADPKARVGPSDLGIDLGAGADAQVFKWLVACQLFGARIKQELAADSFRVLDHAGVLSPRKLADADPHRLVELLDDGGYARYDESAARNLVALGAQVVKQYGGRISRLRDDADGADDVSTRVQGFPGVGPKAAEIFLREVGPVWKL
jgi:endonuclease III